MQHCPYCDYSLAGNVSGRCPECGNSIPAADFVLLPWKRSQGSRAAVGFVHTFFIAILHPRRFLRNLRERREIPVRRPWFFLGMVLLTAIAALVVAEALMTLLAIGWRTGSLASAWRVLIRLWRYPGIGVWDLLRTGGVVATFVFAVVLAGLTLQCGQSAGSRQKVNLGSRCVSLAIFFLPLFMVRTCLYVVGTLGFTEGRLKDAVYLVAYVDHGLLVCYSAVLLLCGVSVFADRRWTMLIATVLYGLALWLFLRLMLILTVTIQLMLFAYRW